jgi:Zn-dependent peptidase ImmA (M78 family)/transcriptional regulator with XRE-family HTH domain
VRDLIHGSGKTQHEFAVAIGLDDPKLSKSLSGARRFSSVDLARIAELCGVTVDWLITGDEPDVAVAARTTGGSAKDALNEARRLTTLRSDLAALGFPQPWRPLSVRPESGLAVDQGKQLAAAALDRLAFEELDVSDLCNTIERGFGADVAVLDLGSGFDGLAASSATAHLIIACTSQVPARQRFTLAHELGHLLAGDDHGLHLDKDIFDKAQQRDVTELRANAFAAALLMPEDRLRQAVGSQGLSEWGFATLSCDLLVSPSTLAYRLLKLRLIDNGTCSRFASISGAAAARLAGRTDEWAHRVDQASSPRRPGLLLRDTYSAYAAGATTLRPYANLLGVDVDGLRAALEADAGAVGAL